MLNNYTRIMIAWITTWGILELAAVWLNNFDQLCLLCLHWFDFIFEHV